MEILQRTVPVLHLLQFLFQSINHRYPLLADAQQRKIRTLQQQLSDAERALVQAKLSSAFIGSGEDVKAAKAQINRLLREVEKCIELVSAKV